LEILFILSESFMRKKIVVANWKMNMTQAESARFVERQSLARINRMGRIGFF